MCMELNEDSNTGEIDMMYGMEDEPFHSVVVYISQNSPNTKQLFQ